MNWASYWPAAALTLEPRLSSKWITNIGFFGCIISLPVPSASFYLPNSSLYQPTPPSLSAMIENILPSVQTKIHFSKGLLSSSGLVQHCTALALTKCLVKFQAVDAELQKVAFALEEDEEDGQWSKRLKELAQEVRRRVPDFQVVLAFSHQKQSVVPGGSTLQSNPTKIALLAESAQRLLWLYHRSLPSMVAETRFEFGKLLQTFTTEGGLSDQADTASRLYRVQQLHILKLLNESDQFVWTTKIGMFKVFIQFTHTSATLQDRGRTVLSAFYYVRWFHLPYLQFERLFPLFFDTSYRKAFSFKKILMNPTFG